jgi:hypothetical protein
MTGNGQALTVCWNNPSSVLCQKPRPARIRMQCLQERRKPGFDAQGSRRHVLGLGVAAKLDEPFFQGRQRFVVHSSIRIGFRKSHAVTYTFGRRDQSQQRCIGLRPTFRRGIEKCDRVILVLASRNLRDERQRCLVTLLQNEKPCYFHVQLDAGLDASAGIDLPHLAILAQRLIKVRSRREIDGEIVSSLPPRAR